MATGVWIKKKYLFRYVYIVSWHLIFHLQIHKQINMLEALKSPAGKKSYFTCLTMDFSHTVVKQLHIEAHENKNNLQKTFQGNDQSFNIKTKN